MSNKVFYVSVVMVLLSSIYLRVVLFNESFIFIDIQNSLLEVGIQFVHTELRELALSYSIMIVLLIGIFIPVQNLMVNLVLGAYCPKYKKFLRIRDIDCSLSTQEAILRSKVSRKYVSMFPLIKVLLHLFSIYLFLLPVITAESGIELATFTLVLMVCGYWALFITSIFRQIDVFYKLPQFYVTTAISALMLFVFPNSLAIYFLVSASAEFLVNKVKTRVIHSEKSKDTTQPSYS